MKLAAIYNTFDGEELLEGSIKQIYDLVDGVIIVYQTQSNFGENYIQLLSTLLAIQYRWPKVRLIEYTPDFTINGLTNEMLKRARGIDEAKELGCTHFLFLDNDEYYEPEQFSKAKLKIAVEGYDVTACRLYTYFKKPEYRLTPIENYWVPFICEIKENQKVGGKWFVYCDPTRGVRPFDKSYKFEEDELMMHHYSYVRKDIARKLRNSSARGNFKNIGEMVSGFESWEPGDELVWYKGHSVVEVNNQFGI
jgi:hypothetical protein